jgi:hypothetical protein
MVDCITEVFVIEKEDFHPAFSSVELSNRSFLMEARVYPSGGVRKLVRCNFYERCVGAKVSSSNVMYVRVQGCAA